MIVKQFLPEDLLSRTLDAYKLYLQKLLCSVIAMKKQMIFDIIVVKLLSTLIRLESTMQFGNVELRNAANLRSVLSFIFKVFILHYCSL